MSNKKQSLLVGGLISSAGMFFAKAIGVSLRTVSNYEAGTRYPKKRETYYKMAEVLKVDVNYLLTDDEEFLLNAESKYGSKGARGRL